MAIRREAHPSDEEIRGAVVHALARDGRVHEYDIIHVEVHGGKVLLSGVIGSAEEKAAAADVAWRIHGASGVDNRVTIATEGSAP